MNSVAALRLASILCLRRGASSAGAKRYRLSHRAQGDTLLSVLVLTALVAWPLSSATAADTTHVNGGTTSSEIDTANASLYAHKRFKLIKGKGQPVCDAYLRALNSMTFYHIPQCGRPENHQQPGFAKRQRVALTESEFLRLLDPLGALMSRNDLGFDQDAYNRKVGSTKWPAPTREERLNRALDSYRLSVRSLIPFRDPPFFRFQPLVDIDNDGVLDDVVIYGAGAPCGTVYPSSPYPHVNDMAIAVLDTSGEIDEKRTRAIFEHPFPVKHGVGMRFVGVSPGVFQFRESTYFDVFYDAYGDTKNRPRGRTGDGWPDNYTNVLAVFRYRAGVRELVCEFSTPYERSK